MVGRQLPFMVPIVLFWIMAIMDGWRGVKETWPAVVVGASSFAIAQYLTSNFVGPKITRYYGCNCIPDFFNNFV